MRKPIPRNTLCNMPAANDAVTPETRCGAGVRRNKLSTDELAAALRVVPQSIRAALCRKGHYLGLRPLKLPNGKLLWDASEVECLLFGEVA